MSYLVSPFEVSSKTLLGPVKCHFVHLYSAIATRHSDTIDCLFLVDGQKVTVAISCAALAELHENANVSLRDQQLAEIAALYLRRTIEQGYDPAKTELFIGGEDLRALAREMGHL